MKQGTVTSSFGTNGRINHNSDKFYDSRFYKELNTQNIQFNEPENEFPKSLENTIILGSSENMMMWEMLDNYTAQNN